MLTAIGMAVGLGNIWRFPYIMGTNGGAGFLFIYLVTVFSVSMPILIMELIIGRRGQANPVDSVINVARESGVSSKWKIIGLVGVLNNVLTLSFYFVVAGWVLAYVPKLLNGSLITDSSDTVSSSYYSLLSNPLLVIFWQTLCIVFVAGMLLRGVKGGLERAMKIMMPALFVLLVALVVISCSVGNFTATLNFLFRPSTSGITSEVFLVALGQAFFTMGVGGSAGIVFGSYLKKNQTSLASSGLGIALADTSVAALAGFAVFPIVFARGISPALGEELVFITMPLAFSEVPYGAFLYTLFMAMLSMAALTSAIAIFEIPLTWLTERLQVARRKAIVLLAGFLWLATMLVSFSFNLLSEFHPLEFINGFETSTLFDLVMFANLEVFFPLGALLVVVFFAYRLDKTIALDELNWKESRITTLLYFHARYLIPLAIVIMMAAS